MIPSASEEIIETMLCIGSIIWKYHGEHKIIDRDKYYYHLVKNELSHIAYI
jgi:hypothetical protein